MSDTFALIIGNNSYFEPFNLNNAIFDAQAIKNVFVNLGYDVVEYYDVDIAHIVEVLRVIKEKIKNYKHFILYYAGHGMECRGINYLPAIDCQLQFADEYSLSHQSIGLNEIMKILNENTENVNIVILDACRQEINERGVVGNSFAPINAPKGTLIAFATSPKMKAKDDGIDGHSLYTGALLKYIGSERLSVETLFKKVRQTVALLSKGTQVPWEHTSLIGDFYFNKGQMVVAKNLPYAENVIKDRLYNQLDEFGLLIEELASANWYRQNAAFPKIIAMIPNFDANQKFILGRNLYQASANPFNVANYFESLGNNLHRYSENYGVNHILNGILFEIYFDSNGDFRDVLKAEDLDSVLLLRKDHRFIKSFEFIREALSSYSDRLLYLPSDDDTPIGINIEMDLHKSNEDKQYITKISVGDYNVTPNIASHIWFTEENLKITLSSLFAIPIDLMRINSQIKITASKIKTDWDL